MKSETGTIIRYLFIVFVITGGIFFAITMFIQAKSDQVQKADIKSNELSIVNSEKAIISGKISRLVSDLLYISDSLQLDYPADGDYSRIEKQWTSFSDRKKIYDQIRYIDADGNEVIRINHGDGGAYAVTASKLQNKADRYYFSDTISLPEDQVYISPLDLNIENGTIESPIKPMLRLSTPFYTKDGKLKGIVILNYSASDILKQVRKISSASYGTISMLNSDGYWLFDSEDSSKAWAFMYKDKHGISFSAMYPDEWKKIKNSKSSSLLSGNGKYIYRKISMKDAVLAGSGVAVSCRSKNWYIVSSISPDSAKGFLFTDDLPDLAARVLAKYYLVYVILLLTAVTLAVSITRNRIESSKVRYYSRYDAMTGVYNRSSGLDKLNDLYNDHYTGDHKISICFTDINGLKEVNDSFGHNAGDELILSVTGGIKENIRGKDFVARLGGDEFLIIFEGLDAQEAEKIWCRINKKYDEINRTEKRKYVISVSHGIETLDPSSDSDVDDIINKADEKMYDEKRRIKKDLKIIR